ncbi:MAG: MMPL family transporter [Acidimicrobiia bacterium]
MSRLLYRLGSFSVRRRRWVLAAWILVAVAIGAVGGALGGQTSEDFAIPGTESQAALDLLSERFPEQSGSSVRAVVAAPEGVDLSTPTPAMQDFAVRLAGVDGVAEVTDPVDPPTWARHLAADGTIAYLDVTFTTEPVDMGPEVLDALKAAAAPLDDAGYTTAFGGDIMAEASEPASEMMGLGVAVVVLLFAFGSVIAMGLPIVTALIGLAVGMGGITTASAFWSVSEIAPMLAMMIGLAVGIDYALFVVTRHRQFLAEGYAPEEAAARATATAGGAVLFAGATVVIAITGLALAGIPMVTVMGLATAGVVAVAVAVALTLLPAMLGFAGRRIDRLRVPGLRIRAENDARSLSGRWARKVTVRPLPWLIGSLAFLGLLIVPLGSLQLAMPDAGNDPPGSTTRIDYDLLSEGFGDGFNSPLAVVVDLAGVPAADRDAAVADLTDAVAGAPGVVAAFPGGTNPGGDLAMITAMPSTSHQDAATAEVVHRLRDDVLPAAVADGPAAGAVASITGSAAYVIDMSDLLARRLPVFIGAVLLLSFGLLVAVFRSLVVPAKAAIANLLSIGGAYGVIVAVFQWGWGADLFGVAETMPIISFLPMMMFAILFGLSMDYEVFILSRVREEYVRTGDPHASVVTGIATSARVITAAALIMISVFGSFVLGDDAIIKMFGLGLATAVLLDATVVRMVFVPATMALLGARNWWLPRPLARVLPNLDIEGAHLFDHQPPDGPVGPDRERIPERVSV